MPRDWLVPGSVPLVVEGATTRYGRISFTMAPESTLSDYMVKLNVTLPSMSAGPSGGLRVRIRAPSQQAGKMSAVTVGGKSWSGFDAATETINFKLSDLTPRMLSDGLPNIVADYGSILERNRTARPFHT